MENLELKLKVLIRRLKEVGKNCDFMIFDDNIGVMERAIIESQKDICYKIGEYIEEIMEMDLEHIQK
jgi:hypothetical protein